MFCVVMDGASMILVIAGSCCFPPGIDVPMAAQDEGLFAIYPFMMLINCTDKCHPQMPLVPYIYAPFQDILKYLKISPIFSYINFMPAL